MFWRMSITAQTCPRAMRVPTSGITSSRRV
jgi:hypothetical protein